jgi:hypothetical protein
MGFLALTPFLPFLLMVIAEYLKRFTSNGTLALLKKRGKFVSEAL